MVSATKGQVVSPGCCTHRQGEKTFRNSSARSLALLIQVVKVPAVQLGKGKFSEGKHSSGLQIFFTFFLTLDFPICACPGCTNVGAAVCPVGRQLDGPCSKASVCKNQRKVGQCGPAWCHTAAGHRDSRARRDPCGFQISTIKSGLEILFWAGSIFIMFEWQQTKLEALWLVLLYYSLSKNI